MVYVSKERRKGWLWEHRNPVLVVCFAVVVSGVFSASTNFVPFPLDLLLGAAVLASILVIIWLSMISRSPQDQAQATI
jgi:peptidoglycan/LPS O-acetylase OafA/YrhL